MSTRDVYTAIADPTRRQILDLLYEKDAASAGEIAARFHSTSRPAISRHLRVLRECGVVESAPRGKMRIYVLVPEPINEIRKGWLQKFSTRNMQGLVRLRQIAEAD